LAQEKVADKHARLVAPDHSRRLAAAPRSAFIDHIVMQQRRGMHELDRRRRTDMTVAGVAAQFCRRERQHRPQPLAAAIDQVMGKLGDHLDIGHRLVENDAIDRFHIVGHEVEKRLELLARFADIFERYNATQVGPQCSVPC